MFLFFFHTRSYVNFWGRPGEGHFWEEILGLFRSRAPAPGSVPDVAADKSSASGRFGARPLTDPGCRPTGMDSLW